jgi:hypothetical protein
MTIILSQNAFKYLSQVSHNMPLSDDQPQITTSIRQGESGD